MATAADALVIMTKAPEPGQVKTRLVPPLDYAEAAALASALLHDQLDNLAKFTGASRFINYAPRDAGDHFASFASLGFALFAQEGADLGARMRHAFERLFASGFARVVLVGSDLPVLQHKTLKAAFETLDGRAEVVFAPTLDGGYYLVGMRRPVFDVFENIVWSRNDVLERSIHALTRIGIRYELLSTSYDIDAVDDIRRLFSDCENGGLTMPATVAVLKRLRFKGIL